MDGRRLLLVHAHPDDEAIGTGATMIRYARQGSTVVLVTCTPGEVGKFAVEHYLLVRGERGPGSGPHGWENDLFAGVGNPT